MNIAQRRILLTAVTVITSMFWCPPFIGWRGEPHYLTLWQLQWVNDWRIDINRMIGQIVLVLIPTALLVLVFKSSHDSDQKR